MTLLLLSILTKTVSAYNPTWSTLKSSTAWEVQDTVQTEVGKVTVSKQLNGGFPCFAGHMIYPEQLDVSLMIEIAADAESAIDWSSAGIVHAKTLKRTDAFVDYWQYLNVPVFSDRMWFLRGYFEASGDVSVFRWERLEPSGEHRQFYEEKIKQYPHAEVTPINFGAWQISNRGDTTSITYRICSHPGGSLSPILQSVATESTLPNNLRDLVVETKKRMETQ